MDASSSTCHFAPVFSDSNKRKSPQQPVPPKGFPGLPSDWLVEFETFSRESAHLFAHLFRPATPQPDRQHKALVILHGQGEHSGRYIHWPHYLKDTVGSIYALDHRGHGQSSGNRGHVDHFDVYAHDAAFAIARYTRYLKARYGKAEIHLMGHSMGGLVVLRALQLHPELELASVSLSAPMIELAFKVPKIKLLASKLLFKILPSLSVPTEPLGDLVSRDPEVVKHYKHDPLNHGMASSAFFLSYLEVKEKLKAGAGSIQFPQLYLIPEADRVIDPDATKKLFTAIGAKDKKEILYPGLYHEIFNEPEKDRVFEDLKKWIAAHSR